MPEYRITATFDGHGRNAETGERLLEALLEQAPDAGPVVDQDAAADQLSVTVMLDAPNLPATANELADLLNRTLLRIVGRLDPVDVHVHRRRPHPPGALTPA